ncbi:MAG TPA: pitrilysin family protein [Armatimonadota bacterium]|jgi:predicted Zn-dependent peptidase
MIKTETLPNGVRVITEDVPYVQSVSIGIWADSGSRDENDCVLGISHFIEHMLFKGTPTRTARQIADAFDSLGGQINAFTEKEYTCYYAKVLSEHMPIAFEILSDMFLNSSIDPQEIELEKKVVIEEIKRHEDTPDDLVHDLFAETVWESHPLGRSILGSVGTVSAFTQADLKEFMNARYTPDSIVISAAGNLVHEQVVDIISGLFGQIEGKRTELSHSRPAFTSESKITTKTTEQVHLCIGTPGFSHQDREKYALAVIDATLGGGISSRLFQEIREKRGLAYSIGSYSVAHREGGFFTVYAGTSMENVEEVVNLVKVEFDNVRDRNITEEELTRAKNQIRGAILLGLEGMSSRMIRAAKSELYYGRIVPVEEIVSAVMEVTHEDVQRIAGQIFAEPAYPVVAIGPFNGRKDVHCS